MRLMLSTAFAALGTMAAQLLMISDALAGVGGGSGGGAVSVAEPASMAIFAAGVGGLYLVKKFRNRS